MSKMASWVFYQQEISWILTRCDNLAYVQKIGSVQFTWQQKVTVKFFNTLHSKRWRFHTLLKHFGLKTYQNEYWIGKNGKNNSDIEATSVVLRYTMYRSRALVCRWMWMLQPVTIHTLPRTNNSILQLTWVWIVVGVYKIYCSKI